MPAERSRWLWSRDGETGEVAGFRIILGFCDRLLEHAMNLQAKRRATTDGVLYKLCDRFDRLMERGRNRQGDEANELPTRVGNYRGRSASAQRTAELICCNYKKVEKIRKIRRDGTPEVQEAVKNDKMSINRAYTLIRKMAQNAQQAPEEKSPVAPAKTVKLQLSPENFAGLQALGGDLQSLVNMAVEQFISGMRDGERAEEHDTEERTHS